MSQPRQDTEDAPRPVKLFRNGRNQAVRIPRQFELPGDGATIRRSGAALVIEPAPTLSLTAWLATLSDLDEAWPSLEDPAPEPVEL